MYSKMVARQLAEATEVAAAVGKNAGTVAAALLERMAKNPGNPSPVDWKAVLESLGLTLGSAAWFASFTSGATPAKRSSRSSG